MRIRVFLSLTTLLLIGAAAQETGRNLSISGIVVNSKTGEPVRRALVSISSRAVRSTRSRNGPMSPLSRSVFTDAAGQFRFDALPGGEYSVAAQKPQFVFENGANVELSRPVDDLTVKLTPLGIITGKVMNQSGEPVRGANVLALRIQIEDGFKRSRSENSNQLRQYLPLAKRVRVEAFGSSSERIPVIKEQKGQARRPAPLN